MNEGIILNNIALQIKRDLSAKSALSCGLLGGDLGKIIYLYLYSRKDSTWVESADILLDKLLHTYRNKPFIMSYCNGLAGLGTGLLILEREGFITGVNENLSEFDDMLDSALSVYLMSNNIDFLHGATGLGFYFLKRLNQGKGNCHNPLMRFIEYLCENAIWSTDQQGKETVKWIFDNKTAIKKYNISLSHGMSSVAILLSRIVNEKTDIPENIRAKIHGILIGVRNFILSQAINPEAHGCLFPTFPKERQEGINKSRLAWCYGDIGILFALLNMSKALDDRNTYKFALEWAKWEAVNRRNAIDNMVYDACICHGASGVAQAFKAFGLISRDSSFQEAYKYWMSTTLNMCTKINGDFEFRNYDVANHKWRTTNSFLEGNAGVGTMLCNADSVLNEILLYKY